MSVDDLEQRVSDLERRHDRTRALLVDALSGAVILLIGFFVRPDGWFAAILGFSGGLFVPRVITPLFLRDRPADQANASKCAPPVAPWRDLDRGSIGNRKAAG
jgi:hypothetical protein